MIRRRRIGAKKPVRVIGSNCPGLAFPKGLTREEEKVRKRLDANERIAAVRRQVWARSGGVCELCLESEIDAVKRGDPGKLSHEMHECYSRAKTRRMKPEYRYATPFCLRLCVRCHKEVTANRLVAAFFDVTRGADAGPQCIATARNNALIPAGWYTAEEVWRHATTGETIK